MADYDILGPTDEEELLRRAYEAADQASGIYGMDPYKYRSSPDPLPLPAEAPAVVPPDVPGAGSKAATKMALASIKDSIDENRSDSPNSGDKRKQRMSTAGNVLQAILGLAGAGMGIAGAAKGDPRLSGVGQGIAGVASGLGETLRGPQMRAQQEAARQSAESRAERALGVQEGQLALGERASDRGDRQLDMQGEKFGLDRRKFDLQIQQAQAELGRAEFERQMQDPNSEMAANMRENFISTLTAGAKLSPEIVQGIARSASPGQMQKLLSEIPDMRARQSRAETISKGSRDLSGITSSDAKEIKSTVGDVRAAVGFLDSAIANLGKITAADKASAVGQQLPVVGALVPTTENLVNLTSDTTAAVKILGRALEGGKLAEGDQRVYQSLASDFTDPREVVQLATQGDGVAKAKLRKMRELGLRYAEEQIRARNVDPAQFNLGTTGQTSPVQARPFDPAAVKFSGVVNGRRMGFASRQAAVKNGAADIKPLP